MEWHFGVALWFGGILTVFHSMTAQPILMPSNICDMGAVNIINNF